MDGATVELAVNLATALAGGAVVGCLTLLATRSRTRAEAEKLRAEAAMLKVQATQLATGFSPPSTNTGANGMPPGWRITGMHPECYEFGVDRTLAHSGSRCAFIFSRPDPEAFGAIVQSFNAAPYLEKRLHLSGFLKVQGVEQQACLWMRADGSQGTTLAFDNMNDRPLRGTRDWTECNIVIDIPVGSSTILLGALLTGRGKVWIDDLVLVEAKDLELTAPDFKQHAHDGPRNLDFES